MRVIEILSSRREYTKVNPFVVLLGKGNHEITSSWRCGTHDIVYATTLCITRGNIMFLGKGKPTTTMLGGFVTCIENVENITFKNMTVTNTSEDGAGIDMSNAKVELFDVALKGCQDASLFILEPTSETTLVATRCEFANCSEGVVVYGSLTSATFKNCVFHENSGDGINVTRSATILLHGEATAVHSNGSNGIYASGIGTQVLIHLPSHHNTSYNNGVEDRHARGGATMHAYYQRRRLKHTRQK